MPIGEQDAVYERTVIGEETSLDRRKIAARHERQLGVYLVRLVEHAFNIGGRVSLGQVMREVIDAPRYQVGLLQAELREFHRPALVIEPERFGEHLRSEEHTS